MKNVHLIFASIKEYSTFQIEIYLNEKSRHWQRKEIRFAWKVIIELTVMEEKYECRAMSKI